MVLCTSWWEVISVEPVLQAPLPIVSLDLHGLSTVNISPSIFFHVPFPDSAIDPLFMLHHGAIDKLFSDWQAHSPKNSKAFAGGSVQFTTPEEYYAYPIGLPPALEKTDTFPMDSLFDTATIESVLDTRSLCYVYK